MNYHFYQKEWKYKVEKLVANLHDKKEYVIHVRNLNHTLNHGLVLKKVHRVIKFNQKAGLKPHIDMITEVRKKAENYFEIFFSNWSTIQFLEKPWKMRENIETTNL